MDKDRAFLENDPESGEQITLESILAEYKGSAFIDGDKKTPADILDKKAEEIIREVLGKPPLEEEPSPEPAYEPEIAPEPEKKPEITLEAKPEPEKPEEEPAPVIPQEPAKPVEDTMFFGGSVFDEPKKEPFAEKPEPEADLGETKIQPPLAGDFEDDGDTKFFPGVSYADEGATRRFSAEAEEGIKEGAEKLESDKKLKLPVKLPNIGLPSLAGLLRRKKGEKDDDVIPFDTFKKPEEETFEPEPEIPEPDLSSEARRYKEKLGKYPFRGVIGFVICLIMFIITLIANAGGKVPFVGANPAAVTGVLLILQLLVIALGLDVLISGVDDLVSARPGVDSLILVSNVISLLGGIVAMAAGTCANGLPFSLISACSLWCAIRGRRMWDIAMYSSLRAATASANPKAVVLDDSIEDRMVLKKISSGTDGFYRKLTEMDVSESAYLKAAPILFIACVVLAFISSIGKGRPGAFAYAFASMTAMAASFPAALCYSLPFSLAAVTAKKSGGAVAGWGGACDIYEADGALITDDDIFPAGTVRISGVKLFEGVSQELAVRYAASLIITADTGSARAFSELLKSQRLTKAPVRDFACYEGGGIGGTIHNDQVLVGSSAFMNLMSIRVPKGLESRGTVFTAVNGELIAVFVVEFAPANSVKSALVSMQRTKTGMLFAVRDFNVTPYLLEQKFRLSMENVEMISVGDCYKLSADSKPEGAGTVAVVCRDGLSPFAEVITKGRMLRLTALICTVFSIAAAAFGVLLMFIMFANNATISVSPMNAFIYMIAVQVVVSVLSRFALRTAK